MRLYRCRLTAEITGSLAWLFAFLLLSSPAHAWNGKVIKVLSGETFTVIRKNQTMTIKLYGLECPSPQTLLGKKSQNVTRAKIEGRTVKINPVSKDAQNRIIARVSINGQSLNAFLIRSGYGLVNRKQCTASPCDDWIRFERLAHKQQKGIWAEIEALSREIRTGPKK